MSVLILQPREWSQTTRQRQYITPKATSQFNAKALDTKNIHTNQKKAENKKEKITKNGKRRGQQDRNTSEAKWCMYEKVVTILKDNTILPILML